ncbi:MAG: UDP-N-acetylmuramoyl-L-alanine--D-glutamate ligase [Candidatus Limivivens sp.]|nr:UDP-N-acetylmuramoyl-L-alanine--D-glutamate ligase [Candidatus Limivivens sp.]
MNLKGKKVLVFGTGISGIGAAGLLEKTGSIPVLYDSNENLSEQDVRKKLPQDSRAEVITGELPGEVLAELALVVLSPGVPTDLPLVNSMREAGLPIWGEVELAYENGAGDVLAITGTNGKTTTTSLLGEIMKHHQENTFVVGNIGTPYTQEALHMNESSITVAEISSFQLETIDRFRPCVSAILNITPDHLNRHHTMEEYIRVKELITKNQGPKDTCVLNYEDPVLREFGGRLSCQVLFFSSLHKLEKGLWMEGEEILYGDGTRTVSVINTSELNILGRHNHENVMAAVGMALSYGISLEEIRCVLKRFVAVEHRIEFVCEKNGVAYYNDSKGTNPDAAIKGIQAMNRPTVLIGGGYDKGSDFEEWIRAFDGKVRYLVLLGQTREKIAETARRCGFTDIILVDTFEEAVKVSAEKARSGDAVLLSPACASWGMFPNYEVRGRMFKDLVRAL